MTSPWRYAVATERRIVVHRCVGCGSSTAAYEGFPPKSFTGFGSVVWRKSTGGWWCPRCLRPGSKP